MRPWKRRLSMTSVPSCCPSCSFGTLSWSPRRRSHRVGLAAAAVQREHQLGVNLLIQRAIGRHLLQIGYQLLMLPGGRATIAALFPSTLRRNDI